MSNKKASLFKGDYYTENEYNLLCKSLTGTTSLIDLILKANIGKSAKNIKRRLSSLWNINIKDVGEGESAGKEIYNLIYDTPLEDIPLFLNRTSTYTTICQWRFQINK